MPRNMAHCPCPEGASKFSGSRLARTTGGRVLRIDWIEQGGPLVTDPQQRGFGSKLIEGSIAAELGGTARLAFAPVGLRCEIVIPLEKASADFRPAGED
jgi:two-component sensor histidine kinase